MHTSTVIHISLGIHQQLSTYHWGSNSYPHITGDLSTDIHISLGIHQQISTYHWGSINRYLKITGDPSTVIHISLRIHQQISTNHWGSTNSYPHITGDPSTVIHISLGIHQQISTYHWGSNSYPHITGDQDGCSQGPFISEPFAARPFPPLITHPQTLSPPDGVKSLGANGPGTVWGPRVQGQTVWG